MVLLHLPVLSSPVIEAYLRASSEQDANLTVGLELLEEWTLLPFANLTFSQSEVQNRDHLSTPPPGRSPYQFRPHNQDNFSIYCSPQNKPFSPPISIPPIQTSTLRCDRVAKLRFQNVSNSGNHHVDRSYARNPTSVHPNRRGSTVVCGRLYR